MISVHNSSRAFRGWTLGAGGRVEWSTLREEAAVLMSAIALLVQDWQSGRTRKGAIGSE